MSLVDGAWTMIDGGVDFLRVSLVPGDLDLFVFLLVNFSFILDFVLFENDFRTLFLRNLPFSDLNYQKNASLILYISAKLNNFIICNTKLINQTIPSIADVP